MCYFIRWSGVNGKTNCGQRYYLLGTCIFSTFERVIDKIRLQDRLLTRMQTSVAKKKTEINLFQSGWAPKKYVSDKINPKMHPIVMYHFTR